MEKSQTIGLLIAALLLAKKEFKQVTKNATNIDFASTYADLPEIIGCTDDALNKNGLAVIQIPGMDKEGIYVETLLAHTSGEWLSGRCYIGRDDPHGYGSAISYARRYGLQSALNIAAMDDDGNGAANAAKNARKDASNASNGHANGKRYEQKKPAEADWLKVFHRETRNDLVKNPDGTEKIWFWIEFSNNLRAFTDDEELAKNAATFTDETHSAKGRVALTKGKFRLLSLEPIPQ